MIESVVKQELQEEAVGLMSGDEEEDTCPMRRRIHVI